MIHLSQLRLLLYALPQVALMLKYVKNLKFTCADLAKKLRCHRVICLR